MDVSNVIRLYPTAKQANRLARMAGARRWAWNEIIAFIAETKQKENRTPDETECSQHIAKLRKTTCPWLKLIPVKVTDRAISDLFKTRKQANLNFKNYNIVSKKRDKATGRLINPYGYPLPQPRHGTKPSFYVRADRFRIVDRHHVKMTGIKTPVRVKFQHIPHKICNIHVFRVCGYWYMSYSYEANVLQYQSLPCSGETIGIDLGVDMMAILSNGTKYRNPNKDATIVHLLNRIKFLSRRLSHKFECHRSGNVYIRTHNIVKLEHKIARLYKRIADYRNTARHQFVHDIAITRPKCVVIEDLNVKGMMSNHYLAHNVGMVGFYAIRKMLEYYSVLYGFRLVIANPFFPSTQRCCVCGKICGPKSIDGLKIREWTCPYCGTHHDRDINAAINLAHYEEIIKTDSQMRKRLHIKL